MIDSNPNNVIRFFSFCKIMTKVIIIIGLLVTGLAVYAQQPVTTFILVRHAEKEADGSKDPDFSEKGKERATRLHSLLKEASIDAVYSTPYKRTHNTVSTIAQSKNLPVTDYDAMNAEAMQAMLNKHRGGTILVSGHSNTIPWTANLLLGENKYAAWEDSEYDNILIITLTDLGKNAKLLWLSY
jgi:broad specificity phosphatase PhoE